MLTLSRLTLAIERGTLEWWTDPRTGHPCLKTRAGKLFRIRTTPGGILLIPFLPRAVR